MVLFVSMLLLLRETNHPVMSEAWVHDAVTDLGFAGPLALIGLMVLAIVASPIPGGPIAVAAGTLYGTLWGGACVVADALLGAFAAFGAARYLRFDAVRRSTNPVLKYIAVPRPQFTGENGYLLKQLVKLVEEFLASDRLETPSLFHQDPQRRGMLIGLNMDVIVDSVTRHVKQSNRQSLELILDDARLPGRIGNMRTWYTTKPHPPAFKSHLSHVVRDSTWEGYAANVMEKSEGVRACAKNDHLGFEVSYLRNGSRRRYVPDFTVQRTAGTVLVLELKG